jgi:hypothetical protein
MLALASGSWLRSMAGDIDADQCEGPRLVLGVQGKNVEAEEWQKSSLSSW